MKPTLPETPQRHNDGSTIRLVIGGVIGIAVSCLAAILILQYASKTDTGTLDSGLINILSMATGGLLALLAKTSTTPPDSSPPAPTSPLPLPPAATALPADRSTLLP